MKRTWILLLTLGFTTAAAVAQTATPAGMPAAQTPAQSAPAPGSTADLVKQGRQLTSEGKLDDAARVLMRAVEAEPNNFDAQLATGITLDLFGNYGDARRHLAKAIEVAKPEQKTQAMRTMAVSWAFERKAGEAAKYEQPIFDERMGKNDYAGAAEIANELARIYLESDEIDNANIWYKRGYDTAIKKTDLTPAQLALWQFRWEHAQARIAARRKQKEEAQKHVAAAKIALDKTGDKNQQTFYPYLTGYVAFYLGEYKTAVADLQQANQKDPFILVLEGEAQEKLGDKQTATELYNKVIKTYSHNLTNAFARPIARMKLGL